MNGRLPKIPSALAVVSRNVERPKWFLGGIEVETCWDRLTVAKNVDKRRVRVRKRGEKFERA